MAVYADSSFLVSCYVVDTHTSQAKAFLLKHGASLPFTALHELEVRNALRLGVFRQMLTEEQAHASARSIDDDLRAGRLVRTSVRWSAVFRAATRLSARQAGCTQEDTGPMAKKKAIGVTPSSGNVFRDIGFSKEESARLLIRADLLIEVQRAIASRRLKRADAAIILRVTQPRVSDLLRGRLDLFSTDSLIDMLARLGIGVRLVVKAPRSTKVA